MLTIVRQIVAERSLGNALLFTRILLFALVAPLFLRFKLTTVGAIIEPRRPRPFASAVRTEKIQRYVDGVCNSRIIRAQCLVRSVTRYYFLRRAGVQLSLVCGIAEIDDRMVGHSWLVKEGQAFLEPVDPAPRFTIMMRFPIDTAAHPR
jgi:hypothetical protein